MTPIFSAKIYIRLKEMSLLRSGRGIGLLLHVVS